MKGKGGTKQLLHPRCFFDWLGDQIRGKDATQVIVISSWILQLSVIKFLAQVLDSQSFQANEGPWQFHDSLETNGSQGLRGFGDLTAEEQAEVEQMLAEHIASVAQARAPVAAGPAVGALQGGPQGGPQGSPQGGPQVPPPLGPVHIISSDSEGDADDQPLAKAPRLQTEKTSSNEKEGLPAATSPPGRKMPNMLEGVKIPEGPERTGDECSVSTFLAYKDNVDSINCQHHMDNLIGCRCVWTPLFTLSASPVDTYSAISVPRLTLQYWALEVHPSIKQGLGAGLGTAKLCSLCRRPIPHGFLESADVLSKVNQQTRLSLGYSCNALLNRRVRS